jgi:hypothetical protein
MKNIIFPSILAVTVMGCASVASTTNHTPTDTQKAELETNLEAEIETLAETLPETPSQAEALYNEGKHAEAFDMHYLLATRGYDWSQFNTGVSYYTGIEGRLEKDYVEAYAWMITSESMRQEHSRLEGINTLEDMLTEEQMDEAEKRSAVLFAQYGSGKRPSPKLQFISTPSEQGQPTIVLAKQKVIAEDPERCSGIGTRIKRACSGSHSFGTAAEFMNSPIVK